MNPAPIEADKELDDFTITRIIGPDWKPGVPTVWKLKPQEKAALLAWKDQHIGAARIDELKRITKLMPRKSANSEHDVIAIGRVEIEDRLNQLTNTAVTTHVGELPDLSKLDGAKDE